MSFPRAKLLTRQIYRVWFAEMFLHDDGGGGGGERGNFCDRARARDTREDTFIFVIIRALPGAGSRIRT